MAACPSDSPPSPAGTRAGSSTSKPSRSSSAIDRSASRRLAKQPPASATRPGAPAGPGALAGGEHDLGHGLVKARRDQRAPPIRAPLGGQGGDGRPQIDDEGPAALSSTEKG